MLQTSTLKKVPISSIRLPRRSVNKRLIEEVKASIIRAGGIVNPITLASNYVIVDGLARYWAAKELDYSELEAYVRCVK